MELEIFSLRGRTAIVTGASAGLGRRFAHVLSEAGARVGMVARRADVLREMAETIPGCVALPADLSDNADIDRLCTAALKELGGVDILVNNAAWQLQGTHAEDESVDQILRTLQVNLVAPFRLGQAFLASMHDRGRGSIVNVSSIAGSVGMESPQASYAASKGGLNALTRECAMQWGKYGVRVNTLAPGAFESEMGSHFHTEAAVEYVRSNTILRRHGVTADFDGALLFLASDASAYMTGQMITVDGGWTAI